MRTIATWSAGSSIGAPQVTTDGGPRWHQELDYCEPRKAASQYVFRHCQCQVLADCRPMRKPPVSKDGSRPAMEPIMTALPVAPDRLSLSR
jgi:hypothetical protein